MKNKQELLAEVKEALDTGIITAADIKDFIPEAGNSPDAVNTQPDVSPTSDKVSAVDVMFYIAGVVLYSAVMSIIVQSWNDGSAFLHILLSAGVGVGLWSTAYILLAGRTLSDVRKGLINALLLTGSLLVITGGYIITNEIIGGFNDLNFIPGAIMLAVLGGIHIAFDRLVKKDFMLLMGVFLSVATFPVLLFGFLKDASAPRDLWYIIVILSAGLLAYATRVLAKVQPARSELHNIFDSFAVFVALISMYVASYGDHGLLWLGVLVMGVFTLFYLSIVTQDKRLLGNASFFLVITVITVSFKYFSGYGATTSLVLATLGLLGSAAVASGINKKYFEKKKD